MDNKKILDLLYGDVSELYEAIENHRKDATLLLYFMKYAVENITIREAFCKYTIVEVKNDYPKVTYQDVMSVRRVNPETRYMTMGCTLKIEEREKPLEIDNRTWEAVANDMICYWAERINIVPGNVL